MKESESSMEKIPSAMVLHKHVNGVDTIFTTMSGTLVNNPLVKWIGVVRRVYYQVSAEYRRWEYVPVSYLWPDIDPDGYSSVDGLSVEGRKYK